MGRFPERKVLDHGVPDWVEDGAVFFVTIKCRERGENGLCVDGVGKGVLESAMYYHREVEKWFLHLMVLMPDHLHALISVPREASLSELVKAWKRYCAREFGVQWQDGFFEHRLRADEGFEEKMRYVEENPVRARLVEIVEDWEWVVRNLE